LETFQVWLPKTRRLGESVPPSGGSLEIGNSDDGGTDVVFYDWVPPSGGSLEIGNFSTCLREHIPIGLVPPSGGSLEIGNPPRLVSS